MMSAKKNQNTLLRDLLAMSLQLVLGVLAGVVVCAGWLMFKPVTIMDSPPPDKREVTDRHEVIYVRGRPATRGAQGARKQKAFLEKTPGELLFVEEDLNRWLAGAYGSQERTFQIEGVGVTVGPRVPAARLVGDELELGLEIGMDREGGVRTLVVQARGQFVERGGRQVFAPRQVYVGSCPVPWNLGGRQLYQKLMALFPVPENVSSAWQAVGNASVVDSRLRLVIGSGAPAAASAPAPAPVAAQPVTPAATQTQTEPIATTPPSIVPAATAPNVAEPTPAPVNASTSRPAESAPVAPPSTTEPTPVDPAPAPVPTADATAPTVPATPAP